MNESSKATVELQVNGQFVGIVSSIEYTRPAQELPSIDGYARFAPGNEITIEVQLTKPVSLQEGWRLLEDNEELKAADEWYSPLAQEWYSLVNFPWKNGATAGDGLYRRKALVFV